MDFKGSDILSASQFNRGDIEAVLRWQKKMDAISSKKGAVDIFKRKSLLRYLNLRREREFLLRRDA